MRQLKPDVFFVDQLSACVPFLRFLYPRAKVLFYGHFPDRLLAKEGNGLEKILKAAYRKPFDDIESWSTTCADAIVVNSKFTRAVFRNALEGMRTRELKVIYPCVDTMTTQDENDQPLLWREKKIVLSINRYEEKKGLDLAIKAYAMLSVDERKKARLVITGGFDSRVRENATTHKSLQAVADSLQLSHTTLDGSNVPAQEVEATETDILFLLSVSEQLKRRLLNSANLLVYTPKNEHFGIVPLEAMLAGVPVLATNTGGPLETIYDGRTGWLRSPEKVEQWADIMRKPLIPSSADGLKAMGQKGKERVLLEFSQSKMTEDLEQEIQRLCNDKGPRPKVVPKIVEALVFCSVVALVLGVFAVYMTDHFINMEKMRMESENETLAASASEKIHREL